MSNIIITASDYQNDYYCLNGHSIQNISRTDFIRAMITVGAQNSQHFFEGRWLSGIRFRLFNGIACFSLLDFRAENEENVSVGMDGIVTIHK